ncbi:hypothetical protein D3C85_448860 [compost metagenome]
MPAVAGARGLFCSLDRFFHSRQQDRPVAVDIGLIGFRLVMEVRAKTIQCTAADQTVQGALVDTLEVDPGAEIEQILERTFLTRLGNRLDRPFANPLDRTQPINNAAFVINRELELRCIHIRRVEAQLHGANFFDQGHDLVGVVHVRRQYRSHEWSRVMRFQPCGLVRHQAVGGGVGFVEAVTGEFFHQVENVTGQVRVDVVSGATFNETAALLGHFFGLFLTHRPTQHVRAAEGVAGHHLGDLHHLFLVQDDAVGRRQYRLETLVLVVGVRVGNLRAAVLAVDEVVDHARLQRTGTEQRHQGDEVFQAVRLELLDQLLHAARFELEHRGGLGLLQQRVGRLVVQRDEVDVQRLQALLRLFAVDRLQRPLDDGQGAQAEEVELDQAGRLDVVLVELGHQAAALVVAGDRRKVGELGRRDDHAAGVLAGAAGDALELEGHVPDFLGILVDGQEVAQRLLHLVGFFQGHADFEGDHLRQAVGQAVGLALHPRHVAHHRLGRHGAEGDDLAHRVAPVGLGHVVDHPVTAVHAEVDVEVGHRHPLRVEETFEQQVVGQRVEVGDLQHVGNQRAGTRAAAGADRHAVVLRPLDEVHHDQEVAGKAHLDDGAQLELETIDVDLLLRLVIRRVLGQQHLQALFQALKRHLAQVVVDGHALGHREVGQEVGAQAHLDVAAPGDLDGVFQRLGQVAEQLGHLFRGLQVLLVRVGARPARIVEGASLADAHAGLVGLEVVLLEEAHVIGRHQRRRAARGQLDRRVQVLLVVDPAGALHLEIETPGEHALPLMQQRLGLGRIAVEQRLADLALAGAGQGDQSFGRRLDPVALDDHQAIVLALGPAARNQLGEIAVAAAIHRQQGQAAERAVVLAAGQPDIRATDRLDPAAHGRLVELDQRAHVAHVGHRHRRHPRPGHRLDQRLDPHQAVDQGVFGVHAQVNEGGSHGNSVGQIRQDPELYRALSPRTGGFQRFPSPSQIPGAILPRISG